MHPFLIRAYSFLQHVLLLQGKQFKLTGLLFWVLSDMHNDYKLRMLSLSAEFTIEDCTTPNFSSQCQYIAKQKGHENNGNHQKGNQSCRTTQLSDRQLWISVRVINIVFFRVKDLLINLMTRLGLSKAAWIHFSQICFQFTNSNYGVVLNISFHIYTRNKLCSLSTACENKQARRDDESEERERGFVYTLGWLTNKKPKHHKDKRILLHSHTTVFNRVLRIQNKSQLQKTIKDNPVNSQNSKQRHVGDAKRGRKRVRAIRDWLIAFERGTSFINCEQAFRR